METQKEICMTSYGYEPTEKEPTWFVVEKELRNGNGIYIPCMDHARFGINEKEIALIIEPYNVGMRDIDELSKFCKMRDLEFTIWGDSFHNSGHTFGICIYHKDGYERKDVQFWKNRINKIMEEEGIDRVVDQINHDNLRAFQEKWA